jgi:hypothetical protein
MKKKLSFALAAGALTLLMSSCFVLQSFTVLDYTLTPGQGTKVRFNLRPTSVAAFPGRQFVFVMVGVESPAGSQVTVGKATWGTNGLFGGPLPMPANGALLGAMGGGDCASNGIDYTTITGIVWKAFITPQKINDGNKFEQKSVVDVTIHAAGGATTDTNHTIIGISGEWIDNNANDTVDGADFFGCTGIASSPVYVKA